VNRSPGNPTKSLQSGESWRRRESNPRDIPHAFVRVRDSRLSFLRGAPLFLLIAFLASAPLYSRTLGALAVGALFALWLLTLTSVKQTPKQASRWPKQRGRPCKPTKE